MGQYISYRKAAYPSPNRWAWDLTRMGDDRLPKHSFYGHLLYGGSPKHKPEKKWRIVVNNHKTLDVDTDGLNIFMLY